MSVCIKKRKALSSSQAIGMATFLWGPLFWAFINDVAIIMDKQMEDEVELESSSKKRSKSHTKSRTNISSGTIKSKKRTTVNTNAEFWKLLKYLLPCRYCRESYTVFRRQDPPTFPYTKWVFNLHNKVNKKLDKPLYSWDQFHRKVQVYHSFSQPNTLWDMLFILAINYDAKTKKVHMQQFFSWLTLFLPRFITVCHYDPKQVQVLIHPQMNLNSKFSFLTSLAAKYNITYHTQHNQEYFIRHYAPAIAHQTPEELALICGPLIQKCQTFIGQV